MGRHRGAKPPRRYGRSEAISLLSPEYLLSVERWPFHTGPQDHLGLLSHLLVPYRLAVKQAYALALYSAIANRTEPAFALLRYSFGGDRPSQTAHLTRVPRPDSRVGVR